MIHPTAVVDPTAIVGEGTSIWSHACVLSGAIIGRDCKIGHAAFIDRGVRLGDRVWVHNGASIYRPVEIGNDVFVGPNVVFVNDHDPTPDATRDLTGISWKVHDGATIGANVTVMNDVALAEHCLIGAGALVTRPTVAFGVYVGLPARLVGFRCTCRARYGLEPGLPVSCEGCGRCF